VRFFALALVLGLLGAAATLLQMTQLVHGAGVAAPLGANTLIPILLTITLVTLAHRVRIEVMFGWAICAFAALIGAVGFLWIPFGGWLGSAPMVGWGWAVLRYSFTPTVALLLGWGVIGQVSSWRGAVRSYFPLALSGSLFATLPNLALPWLAHLSLPLLLAISITALFGALFAYRWLESAGAAADHSPSFAPLSPKILFGAALIAGGGVAASRLFHPAIQPLLFAPSYVTFYGLSVVLFAITCTLVAPLLLRRTGWSKTAIYASAPVILFGALTAFLFLIDSGHCSWWALLYGSGLTALQSALLFPLAQMLFLSINQSERFAAMSWSLLWIYPLVSHLGDYLSSGVTSAPWLLLLSLLFAGSVIATAIWMGRSESYRQPIT